MAKVKQKVSGKLRCVKFAHAYWRISSCMKLMSLMGYELPAAVQIALKNNAANVLRQYVEETPEAAIASTN